MKAVILAAGEGKRMLPLTLAVPKPLLRIGNKTVLDYIFESLPEEVDEAIVVVGHFKEKIQEYLGNKYLGKSVRYVVQETLDGSAGALLCCKEMFSPGERFLVIYGDEIPIQKEVAECLSHPHSWLCSVTDYPKNGGIATFSADDHILSVVEKPENPTSNISVAGVMVVNSDIFSYKPYAHPLNGEYYLTSLMGQFISTHKVKAVFGRKRPATFLSPDEIDTIQILF